jgi:hypothetical protein
VTSYYGGDVLVYMVVMERCICSWNKPKVTGYVKKKKKGIKGKKEGKNG